jgi:hypothetical protein
MTPRSRIRALNDELRQPAGGAAVMTPVSALGAEAVARS